MYCCNNNINIQIDINNFNKELLNRLKENLKTIKISNKIFFLKELNPFIKYKLNDDMQVLLISDKYNSIEKDNFNLFKYLYLKKTYYNKYIDKYTQCDYYNLKSTFVCLNLNKMIQIGNINIDIEDKIIFIHINHKKGLIDNFYQILKDFLI
jgi:hypothetical protein